MKETAAEMHVNAVLETISYRSTVKNIFNANKKK